MLIRKHTSIKSKYTYLFIVCLKNLGSEFIICCWSKLLFGHTFKELPKVLNYKITRIFLIIQPIRISKMQQFDIIMQQFE